MRCYAVSLECYAEFRFGFFPHSRIVEVDGNLTINTQTNTSNIHYICVVGFFFNFVLVYIIISSVLQALCYARWNACESLCAFFFHLFFFFTSSSLIIDDKKHSLYLEIQSALYTTFWLLISIRYACNRNTESDGTERNMTTIKAIIVIMQKSVIQIECSRV